MWCSERRQFLTLLAAAPLASCGFAPLYGPETAATDALGRITVAPISGRMGFHLGKRLTARLGPAKTPTHRLTVSIRTTSQALAINPQNEITRYSLTGRANFTLTRISDKKRAYSGNVRAFAAYSATASAYATTVAERDARTRLAHALAEQIATRLATSAQMWQT